MKTILRLTSQLLAVGSLLSLCPSLSAAVLTFDAINNSHASALGIVSDGSTPTLAGAFTMNPVVGPGTGGYQTWVAVSGSAVGYNSNSFAMVNFPVVLDPFALSLTPGTAGEYAVIRVNASVLGAGTYALTGAFWGQVLTGTTSDVHVLKNGTEIFGGTVNGYGPTSSVPYSVNVTLTAGDTLDFAVGSGGSIAPGLDYTGLTANFAPVAVPEPAGLPLLTLTGLLVFTQRRKRQNNVNR